MVPPSSEVVCCLPRHSEVNHFHSYALYLLELHQVAVITTSSLLVSKSTQLALVVLIVHQEYQTDFDAQFQFANELQGCS